jgi:hypothetical protein
MPIRTSSDNVARLVLLILLHKQDMFMAREYKSGRAQNIKIRNKFCQGEEQLKCLRKDLTNQYCIQEEIKSRTNSVNACCHSVQNLFSSSLLSKTIKINICRTATLPANFEWV